MKITEEKKRRKDKAYGSSSWDWLFVVSGDKVST